MSRNSEIRAHQIDEVLDLIRESLCILDRRCCDADSGEPCSAEPDPQLWCTACSRAGEALE
jgi:hypothetical protein